MFRLQTKLESMGETVANLEKATVHLQHRQPAWDPVEAFQWFANLAAEDLGQFDQGSAGRLGCAYSFVEEGGRKGGNRGNRENKGNRGNKVNGGNKGNKGNGRNRFY